MSTQAAIRESAFAARQRRQKEAYDKRKNALRSQVLQLNQQPDMSQNAIARKLGVGVKIVRAILVEEGLHVVKEKGW